MSANNNLTVRQQWIVSHIQAQGFATIEAMAEKIGVSAQTIRRELISLEKQNYLIRFHGGAGLSRNMYRIGYAQKLSIGQDSKQRIAATVVKMIPAGATIYLDVGSTVESVARALISHAPINVVTTSAAVAMILASSPQINTFITGGMLRGANGTMTGSHAIQVLSNYIFDIAVSSFGGFDLKGQPTDFDPEKIAVRKAAFTNSHRRIGIADATKFDKTAILRMSGGYPFTDLVVDTIPPAHISSALRDAAGRLVIADDAEPR